MIDGHASASRSELLPIRNWLAPYLSIKSGQHGRSLSPASIIARFTQDTLLTGAIFVILVLATKVLQYFALSMKESPLHFQALEYLEHAIFFSGCTMLGLVVVFVTIISIVDLVRCFIAALLATSNEK